ncbi:deoxyribodipyrimidine photo-lyase [Aliikangiella sp. G2MR2-5]|uniref:cryptochrome/photolyase family protein n=1 Tax=Aliikangiella sp. G2MR2-5 TaxID=2788943 RepID=UPI0018A9BF40|nr:deoxyribodipyrimidine photo-lyase [Aliikangiella sp. G2MR2-5]
MHLVWFRNDLRIQDNPALFRAIEDASKNAEPVIACFCICRSQWEEHGIGHNQQRLMMQALANLNESLTRLNIPLVLLSTDNFENSNKQLESIVSLLKISHLYFNIEYPWNERQRDKLLVERLKNRDSNLNVHRSVADSIVAPWEVVNGEGKGYKVFSAFARSAKNKLGEFLREPLPSPRAMPSGNLKVVNGISEQLTNSVLIEDVSTCLTEVIGSSAAEEKLPLPDISEASVNSKLEDFCRDEINQYQIDRDFPSIEGTSKLSCALALGTISALQCYHRAGKESSDSASKWIDELLWRDFYRAVMWHFSGVSKGRAFNPVDKALQWKNDVHQIQAWKSGNTGIPIIDAAMRQLNTTGWMHNRLRMIVASFLTKNLWVDWRMGEAYFAEKLFDYDFASNNGGWQWCASVGTDAAPYFRVFNPASQQKKFDPQALFIKQWLPELAPYDVRTIHSFEKTALGRYPQPIVDLKQTRKDAIEFFKQAKELASC